MSGSTVLANVGIKFTSLDGTPHVIHRRMQCSMTKSGARTFKTLETSWRMGGEELSTSSSRVKEINDEIPFLLGVSPAILDSVIFCHQDDSLWPMSEPGTLKKKFDEIFDATKWTKGIDAVKITRKKQGEALQIKKRELGQLEEDKKKARANQKAMTELEAEIDSLREQEKVTEEKVQVAQKKSKEKREEANKFLTIVTQLQGLEQEFDWRNTQVTELRESIDMLQESDAELNEALDQFASTSARLQGQIEQDTAQYYELQKEVNETESKLNEKLGEKGRLESDKEKHERQLQTRVEMVQSAAATHGLRGFAHDLDDDQISVFNDKIQGLLSNKKKEHDKLQKELARAADEADAKISQLEGSKSTLTSERTFAKQKRTENDRRIKRLQTDADAVDCDEGHVTILEKSHAALEERYQNAKEGVNNSDWDEKIHEANSELIVLEKASEDLISELHNCTRLSSERAQLDLRKKELKERQGNLESLVGTYSSRISGLLKRDFDIESLRSDYKAALDEQTAVVKKAKTKCDALQTELHQRDFELTEARKRQTMSSRTKAKYEQSVLKALKKVADNPEKVTVDDFEEELETLESDKSEAEINLQLFDEMKKYYTMAETYLETKNKCKLCQRGFDNEQSKSKIRSTIKESLSETRKQQLRKEYADVQKQLVTLTAVRSEYDALVRLRSELSQIKREAEEAQGKREDTLRQVEAAEEEHRKAAEALAELESVSRSVSDITQLHADIQETTEKISKLQSQSQTSGTARSADEVQSAQSANAEKLKEVKKTLETLTRERQRSLDLLSSLQFDLEQSRNKVAQARQQMEKKTALSRDIKALKEDNQHQDEKVSKLDQDLRALQPQIDAARSQRDAERERAREKARLVAEERDHVAQTLSNLKIIENDLQSYVDLGKASALASAERAMKSLQQQHERLKTEMDELMKRINSQKQDQAKGDSRKKNISDNLRYRENCRAIDALEKEMQELKAQNAEEDYRNLMREVKYLEDEERLQASHLSKISGTAGAKDQQMDQMYETHTTFYKDVEAKYKKTKIKVEATKGAIEDLGTFGLMIDKAIVEFHRIKLAEVNRIIDELWRATYHGTDIDTVEIKSENATSGTGSGVRKSYNYRVVMLKTNTEMDMRGRCSAGQKVLASIIIRLALAESFGVNCGLIALDEPTTNLDSDNIRSLAVSLHGIIKARQAQDNFQLIVITHDEEFLRHMRCNEFADSFYRVRRNDQQCSVISREDVTRITE